MTEEETRELPHEGTGSNQEENYESWGLLVTKSTVRLKIWQILQLFGQLNVTQIANLLKESKSTVSRHLNGMEDDKLVKSRADEACCPGRIAPKVYQINPDVMKLAGMETGELSTELHERIEFYKKEIQTNRASIEMITGIMKLLIPIYDEVDSLIKDGTEESFQKADEIFREYMWGPNKENITWFTFNYQTPKAYDFQYKVQKMSNEILKDDFDLEKFEETRKKLKEEWEEVENEQKDPTIKKKYGRFGIMMPLKKIFMKNQPDK